MTKVAFTMSVTSAHATTCKRPCAFPSQQQATDEHWLQPLTPSPDRALQPVPLICAINQHKHGSADYATGIQKAKDTQSRTTGLSGTALPETRSNTHGYLIKTTVWPAFVTIPEEANRHMDQQTTVRLAIRQRKHSAPSSCGGIRRLARLGKAQGPLMAC